MYSTWASFQWSRVSSIRVASTWEYRYQDIDIVDIVDIDIRYCRYCRYSHHVVVEVGRVGVGVQVDWVEQHAQPVRGQARDRVAEGHAVALTTQKYLGRDMKIFGLFRSTFDPVEVSSGLSMSAEPPLGFSSSDSEEVSRKTYPPCRV